jgi:hypothetical protein
MTHDLGRASASWPSHQAKQLSLVLGRPHSPEQCLQRHELQAVLLFGALSQARRRTRPGIPTRHFAHAIHEEFCMNWKEPGNPNGSCYNARIEEVRRKPATANRHQLGYEMITGMRGFARSTLGKRSPTRRIIKEANIFDAYHCWTPARGTSA